MRLFFELAIKAFPLFTITRAPLGLYFHVNWFNDRNKTKVLLNFIDNILAKHKDVYFVTMQQLIHWMRNPTKVTSLNSFVPWACEKRESPCGIPKTCEVVLEMGEGYVEFDFRTEVSVINLDNLAAKLPKFMT